jgi:hypothetical protein
MRSHHVAILSVHDEGRGHSAPKLAARKVATIDGEQFATGGVK